MNPFLERFEDTARSDERRAAFESRAGTGGHCGAALGLRELHQPRAVRRAVQQCRPRRRELGDGGAQRTASALPDVRRRHRDRSSLRTDQRAALATGRGRQDPRRRRGVRDLRQARLRALRLRPERQLPACAGTRVGPDDPEPRLGRLRKGSPGSAPKRRSSPRSSANPAPRSFSAYAPATACLRSECGQWPTWSPAASTGSTRTTSA